MFGAATNRSVAALLVPVALALMLAPLSASRWSRALVLATAALLFAYGAFAAGQIFLVGEGHPIDLFAEARAALGGQPGVDGGTLDATRAPEALARAILVAAAFIAGLLYGQNRRFAYGYLLCFVVTGLLIVLGSLVLFHLDPGVVLWQQKKAYLRDFTATFISRGAAGAWLCLVSFTALVLLARHVSRLLAHDIPDGGGMLRRVVAAGLVSPLRSLALAAGFFIPAYGLMLSGSRLALVVLGIQVIALALFLLVFAGRRSLVVGLGLALSVFGAAATLLWLGGEDIARRLVESDLAADGRWSIWQSTLAGIAERAILGFGAGTFAEGFPRFRLESLFAFGEIRSAHSLPLELAFESGSVMALLVATGWLGTCATLAHGASRLDKFDGLSVAALAAATGAICFTGLDVASQSFGYVLPIVVIVGLGLAQMGQKAERDLSSP